MLKPLDRESKTPLHSQVERALRRLIQEPRYRQGMILPGEVEMSIALGVSRNTLRAAMARLEAEGLLERTPGVGTRVALGRPQTNLAEWYSLSREMRRQGIDLVNYEMSVRQSPAPEDVAAALSIAAGDLVWVIRRLRGWDDCPAVLAISWLHPRLGIQGTEDFRRPLYAVVHEVAGVSPSISREEISAVSADAKLARSLKVDPGYPVLLRRRTILDRSSAPLEYNPNYYRTDRYRLILDLSGPAPATVGEVQPDPV